MGLLKCDLCGARGIHSIELRGYYGMDNWTIWLCCECRMSRPTDQVGGEPCDGECGTGSGS